MLKRKGTVLVSPTPFSRPMFMAETPGAFKRLHDAERKKINPFSGPLPKFVRRAKAAGRTITVRAGRSAKNGRLISTHDADILGHLSWVPYVNPVGERLAIIRKLVEEGYDVRVLFPPVNRGARFVQEYGDFVEEAEKRGARKMRVRSNADVQWVRDMGLQVRGGGNHTIYVRPGTPDIFARIDRTSVRSVSKGGEGGLVVPGDGFVLLSKKAGAIAKEQFERQGLKVYMLPSGVKDYRVMASGRTSASRQPLFYKFAHIDMFINVIPGKKLLVVDPYYYAANKPEIDAVARETGHRVVKVAVSEAPLHPANLLHLPDGRVLINKAPRLARQLEKRGLESGKDYIMMDRKIIANPTFFSGGIRCMTSELVRPRRK